MTKNQDNHSITKKSIEISSVWTAQLSFTVIIREIQQLKSRDSALARNVKTSIEPRLPCFWLQCAFSLTSVPHRCSRTHSHGTHDYLREICPSLFVVEWFLFSSSVTYSPSILTPCQHTPLKRHVAEILSRIRIDRCLEIAQFRFLEIKNDNVEISIFLTIFLSIQKQTISINFKYKFYRFRLQIHLHWKCIRKVANYNILLKGVICL